ncbi:MAG: Lrp/AsnC ligand binding domain-containing protein [Candidatus Thermoplasmatota archaeon]|nr:Lrp/AsnC ligand binding domain-containing protein [Candidatus Thermoplasmatota archaeon]
MVIGFILINTRSHEEGKVLEKLNSTPEVKEAHLLFGEYDIIAKVVARDFNGVSRIVIEKIRSIDGVIHTETLAGIMF